MHNLFFGTSKTVYGQVSYDNILVPGQVSTFAISTPLRSLLNRGSYMSVPVLLFLLKESRKKDKM